MKVLCPAKLNTFLSVGPRDARGYHPLRTIFQAVSLFDELTIEQAERDTFTCDIDLPPRNTVIRAWALLGEYRTLPPLSVALRKRIPTESGLGGGSSDAAGFIRGAMALAGVRLDRHEMRDLTLAVGADVPFFMLGGQARGEGYGEKLTPLPDPPEIWAVVVKPAVGCSTADMYRALDLQSYEWRDFPADDELYNDFLRVAPVECHDAIDRIRFHGAERAGLTGSGSAVYGLYADRSSAERAAIALSLDGYVQSFAVNFLSRSESMTVS